MKKNRKGRRFFMLPLKFDLKMELTTLFVFVSLLNIQANTYSQNTKLTLEMENVSIEQVFNEIESISEFRFLFETATLDLNRKVSVSVKNKKIKSILQFLFLNTDLTYKISDRQILLIKKPFEIKKVQIKNLSIKDIQQQINGVVTDENSQPLPGASVLEKGTDKGVQTDFDGNYSLTVSEGATLVISFIGFTTQEIVVGSQSLINIQMVASATSLDEIVVVGFGTQKKANVTGATGFVEMEDILANRPVTNAIEAIQGTIPGLQILTNSGQPGSSGLNINIRGITSINGGQPLILMNNVPVSIEDVNPQDVASITVLKDASATSIYGARAAFGVVLITTKSPARDQPIKFNYSNTFSFMQPEDLPEKASTYDFINALNDWGTNPFWTGQDIPTWVGFLEEYKTNPSIYPSGFVEFDGLRYPLADTDVIGEWINDPGFTQIHNFGFSGGSAKTSYRISAGYSDEDGIIVTRNDSYRKYNINASLTTDLTSKLSSTTNIIYRNSTRRTPLGSYSSSISYNPYTPASGNFVFDDGTEVPYDTPANREQLKIAPKILDDNVRFFQKLDFNPIKGLHLIGEYTFEKKSSTRITSDNQILTTNPERFVLNAVDPVNTFFRKQNTQTAYNAFNVYGKYDFDINEHNFSLLAGANSEESSIEYFSAQRNNLINTDLPSLSGATGTQTTDDSYGEWAVLGYFGRLNYNFKEKYFLELSGRYDGSSRFPKDDRFGFFPSFSAGWHLGKESFMESVDFLTSLKLRGSWGEVGNQVIIQGNRQIYYPAIPGLGITDYGDRGTNNWLNEVAGSRYSTLLLPNLVSASFTWETVQTVNLGFDASFLNNRLSTSFDWFKRKTLDMLAPGAELPAILGARAPLENVADLETKGWELGLSWKDKINEFTYNLGFSLSDNQAKITKFDNPAGLLSQNYVGREFGEIWGYTTDGYYTEDDFVDGTLNANLTGGTLKDGIPRWEGRNQNPGDIKFVDQDGNGLINDGNNTLGDPGDRTIIGNSTRRYQYGVFGNFDYKNFDFSFLMNGVGKRDLYLNNRVRFPYPDEFSVVYQSQLDYWTPDNRDAFFPRNYPLGGVNYGVSRTTQTKYMLNGAYLRLKNITFGYTIPQKLLDKIKVDKLRFYMAGENLFSINDYPDGINTELNVVGNGGIYPYLRSYSVGLNLTF